MGRSISRSGRLTAGILAMLWLMPGLAGAATRVAFVPADGAGALPEPIPTILFSALTGTKQIQVVEREKVRDCLDELKLTAAGLSDGDAAPHLGKMLAADLIVTGELVAAGGGDQAPPICLFRVIDSRTGIVLRDSLLPVAAAASDISPLISDITSAAATSQLPDEKRRYVSIVAVSSEEPGTQLDSVAQSLTAFLEHDLSQSPGVILLERRRIDTLIQEQNLTGLDLQLKSSATLIDAGIRRGTNSQQIIITLKLHNLDGKNEQQVSFNGSLNDLASARQGAAAAVLHAIDGSISLAPENAPAIESTEFARRAAHLLANKQKHEAVACAEAALALDQSDQTLELASRAWKSLTYDDTWPPLKNPPVMEELCAGIRAEEIKEIQCRRFMADPHRAWEVQNIELFSWALRACQANEIPAAPDTPEHRLWKQLKQSCLVNYSLALEFTLVNKKLAIQFYAEKLGHQVVLAESSAERHQIITEAIAGVDAEVNAGRTDDGQLGYFYAQLTHSGERYRSEPATDDREFWRNYTSHREPYVRAIACRNIMLHGGDEGRAAGVKMFDALLKESPLDPLHTEPGFQNETSEPLVTFAMRPFRDQIESYFEPLLAAAEKNKDVNTLVKCPFVVAEFTRNVRPEISADWRRRIVALLNTLAPDPRLAENAQQLRQLINQQRAGVASRTRPPEIGTGAWSRYRQREIVLKKLDPAMDRLCGFDISGNEMIGLWCNWQHGRNDKTPIKGLIAKAPIAGGDITTIATIDNVDPADFKCIACSADGVAIAQKNKGLYVETNGKVDLLTTRDGLASEEVTSAAWLDGILYLGFDGSLMQFDPRARASKILCSSRAVTPHSALDGGAQYGLPGIIADPARHCVWFTVIDNGNPKVESPRPGLWQYDPAQGKFTQAQQGDGLGVLQWSGKKIVFGGFRPTLFDPATATIKSLTGYNVRTRWLCSRERDCALFQTDFLFEMSGYICAPDGVLSEKPRSNHGFDLVVSTPHGFVAGDSHTGKMFTIEPTDAPILAPVAPTGVAPSQTHADLRP